MAVIVFVPVDEEVLKELEVFRDVEKMREKVKVFVTEVIKNIEDELALSVPIRWTNVPRFLERIASYLYRGELYMSEESAWELGLYIAGYCHGAYSEGEVELLVKRLVGFPLRSLFRLYPEELTVPFYRACGKIGALMLDLETAGKTEELKLLEPLILHADTVLSELSAEQDKIVEKWLSESLRLLGGKEWVRELLDAFCSCDVEKVKKMAKELADALYRVAYSELKTLRDLYLRAIRDLLDYAEKVERIVSKKYPDLAEKIRKLVINPLRKVVQK